MKYLIALLAVLTLNSTQAQDKINEIGIGSASLNQFSLLYRTGNQNNAWRFSLLYVDGENSNYDSPIDSVQSAQKKGSFALSIAREHFIFFSNKINLRVGAGVFGRYYQSNFEQTQVYTSNYKSSGESTGYQVGLVGIFGIDYQLNSKFRLGMELSPNAYYYNNSQKSTNSIDGNTIYDRSGDSEGAKFTLSNQLFFTLFYSL